MNDWREQGLSGDLGDVPTDEELAAAGSPAGDLTDAIAGLDAVTVSPHEHITDAGGVVEAARNAATLLALRSLPQPWTSLPLVEGGELRFLVSSFAASAASDAYLLARPPGFVRVAPATLDATYQDWAGSSEPFTAQATISSRTAAATALPFAQRVGLEREMQSLARRVASHLLAGEMAAAVELAPRMDALFRCLLPREVLDACSRAAPGFASWLAAVSGRGALAPSAEIPAVDVGFMPGDTAWSLPPEDIEAWAFAPGTLVTAAREAGLETTPLSPLHSASAGAAPSFREVTGDQPADWRAVLAALSSPSWRVGLTLLNQRGRTDAGYCVGADGTWLRVLAGGDSVVVSMASKGDLMRDIGVIEDGSALAGFDFLTLSSEELRLVTALADYYYRVGESVLLTAAEDVPAVDTRFDYLTWTAAAGLLGTLPVAGDSRGKLAGADVRLAVRSFGRPRSVLAVSLQTETQTSTIVAVMADGVWLLRPRGAWTSGGIGVHQTIDLLRLSTAEAFQQLSSLLGFELEEPFASGRP